MKDAITAKLTAQAAEYYETANTLLNGPLRGILVVAFCHTMLKIRSTEAK